MRSMVNLEKHITYWREGSIEDLAVAKELVGKGRIRHGLFFAHLALEKMLKAYLCHAKTEMAPKMHDLVRLTKLSGLSVTPEQETFLARFGRFQIEGRYPEMLDPEPTPEHAQRDMNKAEELLSWLIKLL